MCDSMEQYWVLPQDVKAYSSFEDVKGRDDSQLFRDIIIAQAFIQSYTHRKFEKSEVDETIKTATIILAEAYAHNSSEITNSYQSETLDDYSYTLKDTSIDISKLASEKVGLLLEPYMVDKAKGKVTFRISKL